MLPNVDYTSEINSRWRRLMTISDYKVNDNATLALIPKQHEHEGSQVSDLFQSIWYFMF